MQQPQRGLERREEIAPGRQRALRGPASAIAGLTHSMYQSQKSPQKKW